MHKDKWFLTAYFALLLLVVQLAHMGNHSPYSYGWSVFGMSYGMVVDGYPINPDFHPNEPIFDMFYAPAYVDFSSCPNINLPIHAFITSVFVGATRSLMFGHFLANFVVALALFHAYAAFALSRGVRAGAIGLAGTIVAMLPHFSHYMGQPMQYIIGPSLTFLALLAYLVLEHRRERGDAHAKLESNALVVALLCAFLLLNYDPYVGLATIVVYFVFLSGRRLFDWVVLAFATYLPVKLWRNAIPKLGHPNDPTAWDVKKWLTFTTDPINGWKAMWAALDHNVTRPWAVAQVGWNMSLVHVATNFYWFLLLALAYYGLRASRQMRIRGSDRLVPMVVGSFIAFEIVTAAFDSDNNPRRALPLLFVFTWVLTWAVWRAWSSITSRVVFGALAVLTFFHSFADAIFHRPTFALEGTQQSVAGGAKFVLGMDNYELDHKSLAHFPVNGPHPLFHYRRAVWAPEFAWEFIGSHLAMFALVCGFVFLLVRTQLLPRWSTAVWTTFYAVSMVVRFA